MNVLFARVVLRDRTTADVLDLALRFLVAHARPFALVAAFVLPPSIGLTYLVGREVGWAAGWPLAILLSLVAQAPFTELASRLVFEHDVRVRDVLRATAVRAPGLLAIRVVQLAVVAFASMFFVVPALFVGGYAFFLGEVLLLERASPSTAISRLQRLGAGASGDAMVGILLLTALHAAAAVLGDMAGRSIMAEIFAFTPPPAAWDAGMGSFFAALGFWLFVPFAATARLLMYLNVRTRAEGWDVQTRFMAIARRTETDDDGERSTRAPEGRAA